MTDELILKTIKKYCPDMVRIVVEENDVDFFFRGSTEAHTWTAFIPGSTTRRCCEIARYLPVGEYIL